MKRKNKKVGLGQKIEPKTIEAIRKGTQIWNRFVEDDLLAQAQIDREERMLQRDKSVIKLMEMSKEAGIIKERKRIIKLFKFELDNRVTSYNTLEKLDKIKKELKRK